MTSRGETGLSESRIRSEAALGNEVATGRSCGEAGGVEGLLKGRVTSSAMEDGEDEDVLRTPQDSQSAHRLSEPSD